MPLPPADFIACGAGRGAECCKFLVLGTSGAECARFSFLDNHLRNRKDMNAQRIPEEKYPDCQIFKENK